MISEEALAGLSELDAPRILHDGLGPIGQRVLDLSIEFESMTRGGGDLPLVFDSGRGATMTDPDGNIFIDVSAGVAVSSVGRSHPEVVRCIEQQAAQLMHASDVSNTRRSSLAKLLSAIAPPGLGGQCLSYFCQSGSGAVETAVKFARMVTGREQIVAFHGAYHGVWHASKALTTGERFRLGFGPTMGGVIHAPYPYAYRFPLPIGDKTCEEVCGEYLDHLLNTPYTAADNVAAVIVEPVQGEGGYVAPAPEFLKMVRAACDRHGALLIADEVQAGAGRTGKMWSIEHSEVEPDMITFGKGIGGDLPMAGVIIRKDLGSQLEPQSQPQTFAGNALSAAVCAANIEIIRRDGLAERAAEVGKETMDRLAQSMRSIPVIGEVRGRGLMIGVELVVDRETREPLDPESVGGVAATLMRRGIVMVPCGRYGNVLRLMPPLVITRAHMNAAIDALVDVLATVPTTGGS